MIIHNWKKILGVLALALLVSACSDDDDNKDGNAQNGALQLLAGNADTDSSELLDTVGLSADIKNKFGGPDDEPVEISSSDTLNSILNR